MKRAAIAAAIILVVSGSVLGQAKVGTTGPQFLELIPTMRSQATVTGAILFGDNHGHHYNPALLAFRPQYVLSLSTVEQDGGVDFRGGTATGGTFDRNGRGIHVGYSFTHLSSGELRERTYNQGTIETSSRTFDYDGYEHKFTLAYGFPTDFDFSVGVAVNAFKEEVHDFTSDGTAYDIGAAVRHFVMLNQSISVQPFGSIAYQNLGPDVTFIDNAYPLPKRFTVGAGSRFSYHSERLRLAEVTPVVERVMRANDESDFTSIGIEAGLFETGYFRTGDRENANFDSVWGFGVTTVGIQKQLFGDVRISDGFFRWLAANLHVAYDYSEHGGDFSGEPYSISIML